MTKPYRSSARPRNFSATQLTFLRQELDSLQSCGKIRPSSAHHHAPIVLAPKKETFRLCVDFTRLNDAIEPYVYAPHVTDQSWQAAAQASCYSKIDLEAAFHQWRLDPALIPLTAFRTPYGLYEWTVMPFGLSVAPGILQQYMESLLTGSLNHDAIVWIDDILVLGGSKSQCAARTTMILNKLASAGLPIAWEKTLLNVSSTVFAGRLVHNGLAIPENTVSALADWPYPRTQKAQLQYVSTLNFFRSNIPRFADLARPFYLGRAGRTEYNKLRHAALTHCVVHAIRPGEDVSVFADASEFAISFVAIQNQKIVIAHSRAVRREEMTWHIGDKEFLAIVDGLRKFPHLLTGCRIKIHTDHRNILFRLDKKSLTARHARWHETLAGMNTATIVIGSSENPADGFSRRSDYESAFANGGTSRRRRV